MRASSIEEFLELDELYDADARTSLHIQFPHTIVAEGDYPEFDNAVRWCWVNYGPQHGECWSISSEYPACPIVLATEHVKLREAHGKKWEVKGYEKVAAHSHSGDWSILWLGKTDYDHGFAEFLFAREAQLALFVAHIPSIDWGESYPWLSE